MADGYIIYQGIARDSAKYFNMMKSSSKYLNPCDHFMRELSINYPKTEEDEKKINSYMERYKQE